MLNVQKLYHIITVKLKTLKKKKLYIKNIEKNWILIILKRIISTSVNYLTKIIDNLDVSINWQRHKEKNSSHKFYISTLVILWHRMGSILKIILL